MNKWRSNFSEVRSHTISTSPLYYYNSWLFYSQVFIQLVSILCACVIWSFPVSQDSSQQRFDSVLNGCLVYWIRAQFSIWTLFMFRNTMHAPSLIIFRKFVPWKFILSHAVTIWAQSPKTLTIQMDWNHMKRADIEWIHFRIYVFHK